MKHWFPFTDYDFYGYIASGLVFLFAIDYWQFNGSYMQHDKWSLFQGALAILLAYVSGQMIAMLSSIFFEHGIAGGILKPPTKVLMSDKKTWLGYIGKVLIGRNYFPLPNGTREKVLKIAMKETGLSKVQLLANTEEIFMPAYSAARRNEDTRKRIDDFRNQYGFNRNMAFTGLVSVVLMVDRYKEFKDEQAYNWAIFAAVLSTGMFLRFLKFYSCFAGEILRNYAFQKKESK